MPDILGIELRAINIKAGIDHERITANIYIENKKVGEVLNDGWCDETYLEFKDEKKKEKFIEIMKKYYKRKKVTSNSPDRLVNDLLRLNRQYKGVKVEEIPGCYQISFAEE